MKTARKQFTAAFKAAGGSIRSGQRLIGLPGRWLLAAFLGTLGADVGCTAPAAIPPEVLVHQAELEGAIARACAFGETLQHGGGWVRGYSLDLQKRDGEYTEIGPEVILIQPSTPQVATAYLWAYEATGKAGYLDVARRTGDLLARYQALYPHGGFPYEMWVSDAAPNGLAGCHAGGLTKPNITDRAIFDDACTEACIRFLEDLARVSGQEKYRRAWEKGLQCYLDAQYPSGGWPQAYPNATGYSRYYTLNDGVTLDIVRSLLRAWRITGQKKYLDAVVKGGDWLIGARLNGPTFGWAEQYDMDMKPAQARAFEPPAASGNTTRSAMEALMDLFEVTGDRKFLAPFPKAIEWLEKARLPDAGGRRRWARFYALDAEAKPIYGTRSGKVTLDVKDAKPGYGWQSDWGLSRSLERYKRLAALSEADLRATVRRAGERPTFAEVPTMSPNEVAWGEGAPKTLDAEGRWIEGQGTYPISMDLFTRNVTAMAKRLVQIQGRRAGTTLKE